MLFPYPIITETIRETLPVGDYCCEFENGLRPKIVFERKGTDLYSTLTSGHKRFHRELVKAKDHGIKLYLIIEGNLSKVSKGYKYSKVPGDVVTKTMFTMAVKDLLGDTGIFPIFCKDREEMSRFIVEFYSALGRQLFK